VDIRTYIAALRGAMPAAPSEGPPLY